MTNTDHSTAVSGAEDRVLVEQVDRVGVATITGVTEGTNSWTFLMRGDWDDHFSINGCAVPYGAKPRVPWVQTFARHRLAALAQTPDGACAVREAVARLLCEQHGGDPDAVASEPHDSWDGPLWTAFTGDADKVLALATPDAAPIAEQLAESANCSGVRTKHDADCATLYDDGPDGCTCGAEDDAAPIGSADAGANRSEIPNSSIPEGMVPWHGGERAPDDWDGREVVARNGKVVRRPDYWQHRPDPTWSGQWDIIAYTPAALSTAGLKEDAK